MSNITLNTRYVLKTVTEKINLIDNDEWYNELFNDRGHQNGNKLRTYRQFKQERNTELYVALLKPRQHKRVMALFRAGSLLLAIETGRYARPPIPVHNRLSVLCTNNCVETEKHFLLNCSLYDDLRWLLFLNVQIILKILLF